MRSKPQGDHNRAPATVASVVAFATAALALTLAASPAAAVVPPTTVAAAEEHQTERVFTLTVGGTNPVVAGWPLMAGPSYELWSDGSLYFRGGDDADRLYPEVLVAALDDATTAQLADFLGAVDLEAVGGTTEFSSTLTHPTVAILIAGDGTVDDTFASYRIAESGELSPATMALVALVDELDELTPTLDAEPLTSGRAIVVAQPTMDAGDGGPSVWPARVEWSAMAPSIGDSRCIVVEGDELAGTLDAYEIPHGPQQAFDTGDGALVVTGIRVLMPSELGCPPPR